MDIEKVKKLSKYDCLVYWIRERENVRIKKERGQPKPWTDDTILQSYRFCNICRMEDSVSDWLLCNWYKPYYNHKNMVPAVALARFFNLPSSLREITELVFCKGQAKLDQIKATVRALKKRGENVFNGAYIVSGTIGEDKIESVTDYYVKSLVDDPLDIDTSSMEDTHHLILQRYGYGSFMAGQVVADLRWAVDGSWRDRNTWAPVGPGSARGLSRLVFEDRDWITEAKKMKQDKFLHYFDSLVERLKEDLPEFITAKLEAHDYQNCLCEIDKYLRVLEGEGKPKARYQGV